MSRVRSSLLLAMAVVLGAALLAAAGEQGQRRGAPGARRGFGMFFGRGGSLLGLLSMEQVQKELKLNEEQVGKVEGASKKIRQEMRGQFAELRKIQNPAEMRAKMAKLNEQVDAKAREQLQDVISREQVIRLYQIHMQIRGPAYALNNSYVAGRLELTDEQKKKAAEIHKSTQEKQAKLFAGLRNAGQEERGKAFAEFHKVRQAANKEALALLSAEQRKAFRKMLGERFQFQRRRPQ